MDARSSDALVEMIILKLQVSIPPHPSTALYVIVVEPVLNVEPPIGPPI